MKWEMKYGQATNEMGKKDDQATNEIEMKYGQATNEMGNEI